MTEIGYIIIGMLLSWAFYVLYRAFTEGGTVTIREREIKSIDFTNGDVANRTPLGWTGYIGEGRFDFDSLDDFLRSRG